MARWRTEMDRARSTGAGARLTQAGCTCSRPGAARHLPQQPTNPPHAASSTTSIPCGLHIPTYRSPHIQATPQRRRNAEETRSTTHRTHDEPVADIFMTAVRSDAVERLV